MGLLVIFMHTIVEIVDIQFASIHYIYIVKLTY